jgi:hypothetical protein
MNVVRALTAGHLIRRRQTAALPIDQGINYHGHGKADDQHDPAPKIQAKSSRQAAEENRQDKQQSAFLYAANRPTVRATVGAETAPAPYPEKRDRIFMTVRTFHGGCFPFYGSSPN